VKDQWLSCHVRVERMNFKKHDVVVTGFVMAIDAALKPDRGPADQDGASVRGFRLDPREATGLVLGGELAAEIAVVAPKN
jgi:hypothetical protein